MPDCQMESGGKGHPWEKNNRREEKWGGYLEIYGNDKNKKRRERHILDVKNPVCLKVLGDVTLR